MSGAPSHSNESLLVRELSQGNEKAFIQLYETYKDVIYAYSLKLLKSQANAEEILQDVFMKVWQKRETLDAALSFKSYLYTIARNKCFDFLEKAANNNKLRETLFYESQKSFVPADLKLIESDFEKIKEEAYNTLPSKRREIFVLSRENGMTYDEIGEQLGISTSTVKTQMSKALESMRSFLREHRDVSFAMLCLFDSFVR
ncbi:MAG: RNA polymerase sigma-70 factor [Bacteroidota bacterium]